MTTYIIGTDDENGELIVGDSRINTFILRGSKMCKKEIHDLVQAANERIHQDEDSIQCLAKSILDLVSVRNEDGTREGIDLIMEGTDDEAIQLIKEWVHGLGPEDLARDI